jgi:hypothetical protein
VYSFALVLYEIVVGKPVFPPTLSQDQLRHRVMGKRAKIPATVRGFIQKIIRKAWAPEASDRPSFRDIFEELRKNEFCVVRDGFHRKEVQTYINWIGESAPENEDLIP